MTRATRHTGPALPTLLLLATSLTLAVPPAAAEDPTCQGQPATIVGTEYADPLHGTPGDDVVWLGGTPLEPEGVDTFDGAEGDDLICQGAPGKAQVQGDGGDDVYVGTGYASGGAGNDRLIVEFTNPHGVNFSGGDGDDELIGADLTESFEGGEGADRVVAGGGRDYIEEGPGSDVIDAGSGADTVYYGPSYNGFPHGDNVPGPVEIDVPSGTVRSGADLDTVTGTECWVGTTMGDVMLGSPEADCFNGGVGRGRDEIRGRAGDDRITFYSGEAQGGTGDDALLAEYPYDELHDTHNELIRTRTRLVGGPGDDNLRMDGHRVTARGGPGRDRLNLRLGSARENPYDPGARWRIDVPKGLVSGSPDTYKHQVDFAGMEVYLGPVTTDVFVGSAADEVFIGGRGADRAMGGPGRDRLEGGAGPDVLEGGGGRDTLRGGGGRPDLANGGSGRDRCSAERRTNCEARA